MKNSALVLLLAVTIFSISSCKDEEASNPRVDLLMDFYQVYEQEHLENYRTAWVYLGNGNDSLILEELLTDSRNSLEYYLGVTKSDYQVAFSNNQEDQFDFYIGEENNQYYGKFIEDTNDGWEKFRREYRTSSNRDSSFNVFVTKSFESLKVNTVEPDVKFIKESFKTGR